MTSLLMELFTSIARSMKTIMWLNFVLRSLLIDLLWWVTCFNICFRLRKHLKKKRHMDSLQALRKYTLTHSEDSSHLLKADGSSIRCITERCERRYSAQQGGWLNGNRSHHKKKITVAAYLKTVSQQIVLSLIRISSYSWGDSR